MKSNKQYVLTVGIQGSRWGRVESIIDRALPDLCDQSSWWEPQMDYPNNLTGHMYSFWGPYNRLGEQFDHLDLIGADQFRAQLDHEFDPNDPRPFRFIRCHWFSYQLDWIKENCPEMWILLVFREPNISLRWWHESGSWDITYPNYKWYGTSDVLERQANIENKYMYKFVRDNELKFSHSVADIDKWLEHSWPEVYERKQTFQNYTQELDNTLWPILYRGKDHAKD